MRRPSTNIDWSKDWFHPRRDRDGHVESYEDFIDRASHDATRKEGGAYWRSEPDELPTPREVDWQAVVERVDPGDRRNKIRAEVADRRFGNGWSIDDILPRPRGRGRPSNRDRERVRAIRNAWRWLTMNEQRIKQEVARQQLAKLTQRIPAAPHLDAITAMRRRAERCRRERRLDFCGPSIASSRRGGVPEAILRAANPYHVRINLRTGELVRVDPLEMR